MKNRLWFLAAAVMLLTCILLGGCSTEKTDPEKLRDMEFTVVEEADLPDELKQMIDEKKTEPFKLSYSNEAYLYVVQGYGEQKTGGYSIEVEALYETENAVYFDTNLTGPGKDETVVNTPSYPYIVVKTEYLDKNVVFQS